MNASETVLLGPWERPIIVAAFAAVAIWGFSGSWEYPKVERLVAAGAAEIPAVAAPSAEAAGAELFQSNGCYACHSLDGEQKIGPSLLGISGATVELADGSTTLIDEPYLVESILQPAAKRVAGYDSAAMPSYEGLISGEDASALARYIGGLK